MVKFGSARISENGSVNGQRGDQTGNECMIQAGYMHRNGWKIIRAKNPDVANGLAFSMACACNLDKVGYSQNDRYAVFFQGIEGVPTNADCSSLVAWCVRNVGIDVNVDGFYTGNEVERLLATREFNVFGCGSLNDLFTGDILVDSAGTSHTVIVVEGKSRENGNVFDSPEPVLQWGSQGDEVRKLQRFLNDYCNQGLRIDGDFKSKTREALMNFQRFFGINVDGIYGNQSKWVLCCVLVLRGVQPV